MTYWDQKSRCCSFIDCLTVLLNLCHIEAFRSHCSKHFLKMSKQWFGQSLALVSLSTCSYINAECRLIPIFFVCLCDHLWSREKRIHHTNMEISFKICALSQLQQKSNRSEMLSLCAPLFCVCVRHNVQHCNVHYYFVTNFFYFPLFFALNAFYHMIFLQKKKHRLQQVGTQVVLNCAYAHDERRSVGGENWKFISYWILSHIHIKCKRGFKFA